jgi:hypothetical protein
MRFEKDICRKKLAELFSASFARSEVRGYDTSPLGRRENVGSKKVPQHNGGSRSTLAG